MCMSDLDTPVSRVVKMEVRQGKRVVEKCEAEVVMVSATPPAPMRPWPSAISSSISSRRRASTLGGVPEEERARYYSCVHVVGQAKRPVIDIEVPKLFGPDEVSRRASSCLTSTATMPVPKPIAAED
jgi:hypothetical protein